MSNLYYIQDKRSFVGNSVLWWGPDGQGYTTDIDKAGKYDKNEAESICRSRTTDIMWPVDYINSLDLQRHVHADQLNRAVANTYDRCATSSSGKVSL